MKRYLAFHQRVEARRRPTANTPVYIPSTGALGVKMNSDAIYINARYPKTCRARYYAEQRLAHQDKPELQAARLLSRLDGTGCGA